MTVKINIINEADFNNYKNITPLFELGKIEFHG